jgi:transcriptional regulator with XRE-family HTH domain
LSSINRPRQISPTLRRRRLGSELRRLRDASGMNIDEVAAHLHCSSSTVSRIEKARVRVTLSVVRDMLELYGVTGQQREGLILLAREAREKEGWWHAYGDVPDVRTYISFESAAESLHLYESLLIPGLIQIEDYARMVLAIIYPNLRTEEIERHVELRMARQVILRGDDPLVHRVVLDEAALRRLLGMGHLVPNQLRHLIEATEMPNVSVQILPFRAGAHGGMIGPFAILSFPDSADPDVVHIEQPTGDLYLDQDNETQRYRLLFERLRAAALTPDRSTAFMTELMKEL